MTGTAKKNPGTWRNSERSGSRNDLSLSGAVRVLENVKHLDLDLFQYDPDTQQIEIVFESTSSMDYKNTTMSRVIAKQLGAYTFLVQHEWHDEKREFPIYLTIWEPNGKIHEDFKKTKCEWSDLIDLCEQVHEIFEDERKEQGND